MCRMPLPYFQQHQALTFAKEGTEGYQAGLPSVAEEKRDGAHGLLCGCG